MHRHILTLAAILAAAFLCGSASKVAAETIATDDFESYTLGSVLGQGTTGLGWDSAWGGLNATNSAATPVRLVSENVMAGYGKSLEVGFSTFQSGGRSRDDNIVQRTFEAQTGDVYVGFLVMTTGLDTAGYGDFAQMFFNNTVDASSSSGSQNSSLSGLIDFAPDGAAGGYAARKGGEQTNSSLLHVNGEIHQMVIKISKSGDNGGNYDQVAVFVDQTVEGTPDAVRGAADAENLAAGSLATLSQLHLRLYGLDTVADRVYVDNLRVATTYAEAVPEPSCFVLLAAGLALVAARRRWTR